MTQYWVDTEEFVMCFDTYHILSEDRSVLGFGLQELGRNVVTMKRHKFTYMMHFERNGGCFDVCRACMKLKVWNELESCKGSVTKCLECPESYGGWCNENCIWHKKDKTQQINICYDCLKAQECVKFRKKNGCEFLAPCGQINLYLDPECFFRFIYDYDYHRIKGDLEPAVLYHMGG